MGCPGKWKHGPKPAVCPSCGNFGPHPGERFTSYARSFNVHSELVRVAVLPRDPAGTSSLKADRAGRACKSEVNIHQDSAEAVYTPGLISLRVFRRMVDSSWEGNQKEATHLSIRGWSTRQRRSKSELVGAISRPVRSRCSHNETTSELP